MIRKLFPTPVAFILSIEVGLPFLELTWPLCLIAGIFFVICNRMTERLYERQKKYWHKYLVLIAAVPVITFIYSIVMAFENIPLRIKPFHINMLAVRGLLGVSFCTITLLVFMRSVALFIEWWWARFKIIKEQDKSIPVENKNTSLNTK